MVELFSVDISALGPMLAQVTVCLMPLIKQLPQQVAETLNYLIVENR